jgi:Flp pilus assembly protein TadG
VKVNMMRSDRAAAGRRLLESEDGMALIHVGIALLVLMALSSFVLDYGVLWLSRAQAQASADAGALAGATARAFDETTDPPSDDGAAYTSALNSAQANLIFGVAPGVTVTWKCPGFVSGTGCAQVDVTNNALPTFFASIFGVTSQSIQATATAQARPANASDCLRPLAVMDRWLEAQTPPWDPSDTFDRYYLTGKNKGTLLPNPDSYTAPTATDPGTGFTVADNYGQQVTLKSGSSFSGGWFQPVDVPRNGSPDTGAALYRDNLASCSGSAVSIGDYLATETGDMTGPTKKGIGDLISQDSSAVWNVSTQTIDGSCAPTCAPFSPRIIALPVFNPDEFQYDKSNNTWPSCPGGGSCVQVTNIIGFFVDHMDASNNVVGYLIRYPGVLTSKPGGVGGPSSFAQVITLVR